MRLYTRQAIADAVAALRDPYKRALAQLGRKDTLAS